MSNTNVLDLGGIFPFKVGGRTVRMQYSGGLLGHFATDTHSAVKWANAVLEARHGKKWKLTVSEKELAHRVNMCNGALFDAENNFENSVWGVKYRLFSLGLLPGPYCFHETGRKGQAEAITKAYNFNMVLNDCEFLNKKLKLMKREVGIKH